MILTLKSSSFILHQLFNIIIIYIMSLIYLHYHFVLFLLWISTRNRNLSIFCKHLNYFDKYLVRLRCIISQVNSKNLLILIFKIEEFISRNLWILFTKVFLYFVFAWIITIFNIIHHINNSFIIDKIKSL